MDILHTEEAQRAGTCTWSGLDISCHAISDCKSGEESSNFVFLSRQRGHINGNGLPGMKIQVLKIDRKKLA